MEAGARVPGFPFGGMMKYIVFDIEASKIPHHNPWSKESFLCSIGFRFPDGSSRIWLFNHKTEQCRPHDEMIAEIQKLVDDADFLIAHNAKFDLNWLKAAGITCSNKKVWCTQVAEYLIHGQRKVGYSLNALAERRGVDKKLDLMSEYWDNGFNTDEIPVSIHFPYLEQDLKLTHEIFLDQLPVLTNAGLSKIAELVFELTQLLSDTEVTGVKFDTDSAWKYVDEYKGKLVSMDTDLCALAEMEFNPSSSAQLSAVLFGGTVKEDGREFYNVTLKSGVVKEKSRKCKITRTIEGLGFAVPSGCISKKTGKPSVDKNTIKLLQGSNDVQEKFVAVLKKRAVFNKILTSFVSEKTDEGGLIAKVGRDGRIHPSFNQTITATGRLSSSDPNGQNLPRKGTSPIKSVFVSSRGVIANYDLSQVEWRIAAELSRDEVMLYEIMNGVDVHTDNATRFFDAGKFDQDSDEFKKLRTTAKIMTFRLLYGGTAAGFYRDQSMPRYSKEKWESIVNAFYDKYKGLKAWQTSNVEFVKQNGYLRTPTGRLLTFDEETDYDGVLQPKWKQIYNYPVQSCSADIMYLAMVTLNQRIRALGLSSKMVLQVHDSMVFDCLPHEVEQLSTMALDVFNSLPKLAKEYFGWDIIVPLTGDCEFGLDYGKTFGVKPKELSAVCKDIVKYLTLSAKRVTIMSKNKGRWPTQVYACTVLPEGKCSPTLVIVQAKSEDELHSKLHTKYNNGYELINYTVG